MKATNEEMMDATDRDFKDMTRYVKKPIEILARKMERQFVVRTLEGVMAGQAGDYLIIGIEGERYPCKAEIFEKTYSKELSGKTQEPETARREVSRGKTKYDTRTRAPK